MYFDRFNGLARKLDRKLKIEVKCFSFKREFLKLDCLHMLLSDVFMWYETFPEVENDKET